MSRELARADEGPLSAQAAADQVRQLRTARDYVRTCADEAELLDAKRKAEVVRYWARVNKAAGEIALEACRLQATALPRLCQMESSAMEKTAALHQLTRLNDIWQAFIDDTEEDAA